ncbi:MAG: sensor histidine kinase [Ruminococcus sp.]|jgi:signal transduction histidine kinase
MIFTLVLWIIGAIVHLSGPGNKVNRWCSVCFFVTSVGTLKEFLMDWAMPQLTEYFPLITTDLCMSVNSCLTAVLYLGTPFCFITMAMYFGRVDENKPGVFRGVQVFTAAVILCLLLLFSPLKFKEYQMTSPAFWYCMSAYNLGYALVGTGIIIKGIQKEGRESVRRWKKLLVEIMIPPYYWWLGTIFVVHSLRMWEYMKAWKANLYLLLALLLYYLYIALREGLMGIRFSVVMHPWDSDIQAVDKSTQYINHMIKNQAVKIDWCVDILRGKSDTGQQKELDIIERASRQLQDFTRRTTDFLNTAVNESENVQVSVLMRNAAEEFQTVWKDIDIKTECRPDVMLFCDIVNMKEVLHNLLENGKDAMDGRGEIEITGGFERFRRVYCIKVTDTGRGLDGKIKKEVFSPYFTTKKKGIHYGLGLAFCQSIMRAHGGKIRLNSTVGKGTEVSLYFPGRRVRKLL